MAILAAAAIMRWRWPRRPQPYARAVSPRWRRHTSASHARPVRAGPPVRAGCLYGRCTVVGDAAAGRPNGVRRHPRMPSTLILLGLILHRRWCRGSDRRHVRPIFLSSRRLPPADVAHRGPPTRRGGCPPRAPARPAGRPTPAHAHSDSPRPGSAAACASPRLCRARAAAVGEAATRGGRRADAAAGALVGLHRDVIVGSPERGQARRRGRPLMAGKRLPGSPG
jgi:hypothetical protein